MVEKLTFNSLAKDLVDIPAVHSNCVWALHCVTTAHFRVAFYWLQHKVHMCNGTNTLHVAFIFLFSIYLRKSPSRAYRLCLTLTYDQSVSYVLPLATIPTLH
jgi:hypothetical protein